jgi:methylated-DNA-[protein]-cysteine S-methyltransferase
MVAQSRVPDRPDPDTGSAVRIRPASGSRGAYNDDMQTVTVTSAAIPTPAGLVELTIAHDEHVGDALVSLCFVDDSDAPASLAPGDDPAGIVDRLRRYFDGDLHAIDDLPVRFDRGTGFQHEVWGALRTIPVGETISYAELARRVGRPTAFRAVGSANGQNPVGVVVPCHRVIASDGTLGGYAGGLDRKRWLLAHEGATVDDPGPSLPGI